MSTLIKLRAIGAVCNADISEGGWEDRIIDALPDKYARGYLTAKVEALLESYSSDDEEFRERLLLLCEHNIWNR